MKKILFNKKVMNNLKLILTALLFINSNVANAEILSVRVEKPDWFKVLNFDSSWNIILDGEIDADAPARVNEALKKTGSDGADVYINSPGGNLLAGMQIGRLIRNAGANTHIGILITDPSKKFTELGLKYIPGQCLSACTFAFIGGVYRYSVEGSEFGVHRFSKKSGPELNDLDDAQVISAAISTYINEMDVDIELFDLMVQEDKKNIKILSYAETIRLNVINNGRKKPKWSIEAIEGGQYLKGFQESSHGYGKALLSCEKGKMLLSSYYEIGVEKAKNIASGTWYHSLLVNEKVITLPNPDVKIARGNEIFTVFYLSKKSALEIASSSSMGHAIQFVREAPTYFGYSIDIPDSDSQKVSAFIKNCFKR